MNADTELQTIHETVQDGVEDDILADFQRHLRDRYRVKFNRL